MATLSIHYLRGSRRWRRQLGLADALAAAHRKIGITAGLRRGGAGPQADGTSGGAVGRVGCTGPALFYLDMPRWFRGKEDVPHLRTLAEALRQRRRVLHAATAGAAAVWRRRGSLTRSAW